MRTNTEVIMFDSGVVTIDYPNRFLKIFSRAKNFRDGGVLKMMKEAMRVKNV